MHDSISERSNSVLSQDPQLMLEPVRGLLEPSFATARDRTFREKDGLEYTSEGEMEQIGEFCSKKRTKI